MIELRQATIEDLDSIQAIQRESFKALYEKYGDERSPYLDTRERTEEKFYRDNSQFFLIESDSHVVGFVRLLLDLENEQGWLSRIAILPDYQRRGLATQTIEIVEDRFSTISHWKLNTIFQEKGLVKLYEKCGYQVTHTEPEQPGMDLVFMEKRQK